MKLPELADRYETADFMDNDPSQFMHRCSDSINQELAGFVASCLSMGQRKQLCAKITAIMDMAGQDLRTWIMRSEYTEMFPDTGTSFYRTYSHRMIRHLMDGLRDMLLRYGSMGQFILEQAHDGPSAIAAITSYFRPYDVGGLVPKDTSSSCKRVCMFLRWMVRDHSPVDLGLWADRIDKRTLIMPLDTHVMRQSIRLGYLQRSTPTMRTAVLLTEQMRVLFPDDPLKADFALFGLGIDEAYGNNNAR